MKTLVESIYANPKYAKVIEWSRLISITSGAQAIIQAIGLVSGLMIIHLLPTHEYALYTLANTILGTMILLTDGGISTGVLAQGGKVWQDKEKLGAVVITGFNLRKTFSIIGLLIAEPILFFLLKHHGASWLMSVLITLSIIPAFFSSVSASLIQVAPKLHQDIISLQKNQVETNICRLALLFLTLFFFPWAFIGIICSGIPQIWANIRLKKISTSYINWEQKTDPIIRKELFQVVKKILPGAIYYCFSGQISLWIISAFGSTLAIAQVGALGRLIMALNIFGILFSTLLVPRFARMPEIKSSLLNRYLTLLSGFVILSIGICSIVWAFPAEVLWVLGKKYYNLENELLLYTISSCLALITGAAFSLYVSRGWIINPTFSIITSITSTALLAALLNLSTLREVLIFNILTSLIQVVIHCCYGLIRIIKLK
jgi:O-antigen/teichoic acid export membrane protein